MTEDERFEWVRRRGGEKYAAWLAAGYRECYQGQALGRMTNFLLQKRIRDARGVTLYFINVWAYDNHRWPDWNGDPVSFEAECHFNTHIGQSPTFNVALHHPETPEQTEAFFLKMYHAMGCEPYGDD